MSTAPARLAGLDTLRGLAILMVIAFHASIPFELPLLLRKLADLGNQGVQLFFLVSAVTMALMWDARADEPQRVAKFYIRRVLRIAPLYWIAIFVFIGLRAMTGYPQSTPSQTVQNALFVHAFSPDAINSAVSGGWSIGVEMAFYAVFPLLAACRLSPTGLLALAAGLYVAFGLVVTNLLRATTDVSADFLYFSPLTQFPIFPIGMALYAVALRREPLRPLPMALLVFGWLALGLACKLVFKLEGRPFFWLLVFAFAGLVWLVLRRGWHWAPLAWLGGLSYSMYLFHFAVLTGAVRLLPVDWRGSGLVYAGYFGAVVLVSAAVAVASRETFERWSALLARAWVARLDRRRVRPRSLGSDTV